MQETHDMACNRQRRIDGVRLPSALSEGIRNPISSMRKRTFDVTGGSVVNASRVKSDKKYWKITIQPDEDDANK